MNKSYFTSEKRIKFILGLSIAAYSLLILNMMNLQTSVLDNYREMTTAHAPTIDCVYPENLNKALECADE